MSLQPGLPMPLSTEAATLAAGRAAAAALPTGDTPLVVFLSGDLGAGKTCFARALLQALGVQGRIQSPSYALLAQYEAAGWRALHLDLYRLRDASELELLGVRDEHAGRSLWLVEWPERGAGYLPAPDALLQFGMHDEGHSLTVQPASERGQQWCEAWLAGLSQAADGIS